MVDLNLIYIGSKHRRKEMMEEGPSAIIYPLSDTHPLISSVDVGCTYTDTPIGSQDHTLPHVDARPGTNYSMKSNYVAVLYFTTRYIFMEGAVTKIVRSVLMGFEILGLPMFASLGDTELAALLWLVSFDLQYPWHVVTRLSRALSRHPLGCRRTDMFGNRSFPMHLLLF
jgi:hypothetical protein